ncbi:MAG: hypothetical protein R3345_01065 [Fulvivirga sp.]|nr:hypothetical protein [Fulvivirga sp.]
MRHGLIILFFIVVACDRSEHQETHQLVSETLHRASERIRKENISSFVQGYHIAAEKGFRKNELQLTQQMFHVRNATDRLIRTLNSLTTSDSNSAAVQQLLSSISTYEKMVDSLDRDILHSIYKESVTDPFALREKKMKMDEAFFESPMLSRALITFLRYRVLQLEKYFIQSSMNKFGSNCFDCEKLDATFIPDKDVYLQKNSITDSIRATIYIYDREPATVFIRQVSVNGRPIDYQPFRGEMLQYHIPIEDFEEKITEKVVEVELDIWTATGHDSTVVMNQFVLLNPCGP